MTSRSLVAPGSYRPVQAAQAAVRAVIGGPEGSQRQSGVALTTPGQRQRWLLGSRILACAHDTIHMEGPAAFVTDHLGEKLDGVATDEVGVLVNFLLEVVRYVLSLLFIIVIPCTCPVLYEYAVMAPSWGYQMNPTDREHFNMANLNVDVRELRSALADPAKVESNALFLTNQVFQARVADPSFSKLIGLSTLLLLFALYILRSLCYASATGKKYFVISILQSVWNDRFGKLQYTDGTLFGGHVQLYKWVPCAWLATVLSLSMGVPLAIFLVNGELSATLKCLPVALVAGYATGAAYLKLCQATFSMWLSQSPGQTAIVKILFETYMRGIFPKLLEATPVNIFAITVEDMELLASSTTMERLLYAYSEQHQRKAIHGLPLSVEDEEDAVSKYLKTCCMSTLHVVAPEDERRVQINILEREVK